MWVCGRGSNEAAVGLAEDVRLHIQVGQEEQEKQEEQEEQEPEQEPEEPVTHSLFAFPGECNFSGQQLGV